MRILDAGSNICVVGCSDGKFVLPFLRKGFFVTAIDIDPIAIFGGMKSFPISRTTVNRMPYQNTSEKQFYPRLATENRFIDGLLSRLQKEKLEHLACCVLGDYYRDPPRQQFDAVVTSCSLQYKANRSLPVSEMIATLKNNVRPNGLLYMDYMMPLEDTHQWKSEHFLRTGQLQQYFAAGWNILHIKEMKRPVFEAAHIDRPEDHYHRFGYILARKEK